jgi:hypothetical protein
MRHGLRFLTIIVLSFLAWSTANAQVHVVCWGDEVQLCNLHPGWDKFIQCLPSNGVGGPNDSAICQWTCGKNPGPGCSVSQRYPPVAEGYCGWGWYTVGCSGRGISVPWSRNKQPRR